MEHGRGGDPALHEGGEVSKPSAAICKVCGGSITFDGDRWVHRGEPGKAHNFGMGKDGGVEMIAAEPK